MPRSAGGIGGILLDSAAKSTPQRMVQGASRSLGDQVLTQRLRVGLPSPNPCLKRKGRVVAGVVHLLPSHQRWAAMP